MRRPLVIALLVIATAGCGHKSPVAPVAVTGTYAAVTVKDAPLPYLIQADNPRRELLADQLVLDSAATFTESAQIRTTSSGSATTAALNSAGTYSVDGNSVTLHYADGTTQTGEAAGDGTLSFTGDGVTAVYRRQ